MRLKLEVSDSPVKTIHLSAGQMLSDARPHLSAAKGSSHKPQGIPFLPIAAFIKHPVSHCHNTNFPRSCTKGARIFEQLSPATDTLAANLLKDDRPGHHLLTHKRHLRGERLKFYAGLICVRNANYSMAHSNHRPPLRARSPTPTPGN